MNELPTDWQLKKLSNIINGLKGGVSVRSTDERATGDSLGVLKTSAVTSGQFLPEENKTVIADDIQRAREHPKAGSVLISRMNTVNLVGANAYVSKDYKNIVLPDRLWQMQVNDLSLYHPRWLGYIMASKYVRTELSRRATGTSGSMKNITKPDVLSIKIPCPPKIEQVSIARILTHWDLSIEEAEKLIEAKRRFKTSLMQNLLTGSKRLKEFKGQVWNKFRLGELFKERRETNRNDLPLLSITADRGVIYRNELVKKDTSNADKSKYKRIASGDIGYNTMRMWQGNSGVSKLEGIVSPAYTICIPQESIEPDFAGYLFKYPPIIHLFYRFSQGLVSDTLNLKFTNFAQIKVTIPPVDEQKKIAALLQICDKEIDQLCMFSSALKRQKKGLMQKLLTGNVRVPVDH